MKTRKFRYDLILIVSLLLVSFLCVGLLLFLRREGKSVRVEVNGEQIGVYSLDRDGEYVLNGGTNILVIEKGAAYISEADCPDKTCVRKGRISYVGQSAVCLPNRVSVTVVGDGADGVDLVS